MIKKILAGTALFFIACSAWAWHGTVVDKTTDRPVEGAVVVRSWYREHATPGGAVTSSHWEKEAVTDKRGKFTVSASLYFPGIPLLTWVDERRPVVFKPGYKFIIVDEKKPVIKMERIPTVPAARKAEIRAIGSNYGLDFRETNIFRDMVTKEEEFIEIISSFGVRRRPALRTSEPQGPSKMIFAAAASPSAVGDNRGRAEHDHNYKKLSNEERVDSYIKVLQDHARSAYDRMGAASALGYHGDARAVPPLIDALNDVDDNAAVRDRSLIALQQIHDSRAVPSIIQALGNGDTMLKLHAISALGVMKDPSAIPALTRALRDDNTQVRHEAMNVLKNQYREYHVIESLDPGTIDQLIADLGSKNINIQTAATYCLIEIGAPAVGQLVTALSDTNKDVRREAALALGRIHDARAIDPLVGKLTAGGNDPSWPVAQALFLLSDYHNSNAEDAFVSVLAAPDDRTRGFAASALAKGGSSALKKVITAAKNPNAEVRANAVLVLGRIKDITAVDPLLAALRDTSPAVRKNAAIALAAYQDPRTVKPLLTAWDDAYPEVRTSAAGALVSFGTAVVKDLILALQNKDPYIRWRAAWCLGKIKDPSALEALIPALQDGEVEVRWMALDALSEIKDTRASDYVVKLCHSDDEGIRDKAGLATAAIMGGNLCLEKK